VSSKGSDSESQQGSGNDSDSDSDSDKNSDDSTLGKRVRVRHDSSDSDISVDSEEVEMKRVGREQVFKKKIVRALGMGDDKPADAEPKDDNSDISVDDSKSSEVDDENFRKVNF
jgi:hypothetical protein